MSKINKEQDKSILEENAASATIDTAKTATRAALDNAMQNPAGSTSALKTFTSYNNFKFGLLDAAICYPQYLEEEKIKHGESEVRNKVVAGAQYGGSIVASGIGAGVGNVAGSGAGAAIGGVIGGIGGAIAGAGGMIIGAVEGASLGSRIGGYVGTLGGAILGGLGYDNVVSLT